jgi:ABC-type polysaccharide/polyol phosphate transport system ATPase subunit
MSSDLLLIARDLTKVYTGAQNPLATLRQALFGKSSKKVVEYPVLHGIDLEIRRGETVGIMGRNGAGKTTLLGILGNVIQPTSGNVERFGRIATLLGLTAGFNANFSGRENAYLFCSMQGISRAETDKRIGDIEAFADLGRYFDQPLRTYSSGMQSRLAFSCAIHVDCDLIIIDETLAVGDANFRMKCYDRIRHMKESGQTFLLVSHNQNMVANFCTRGIILEGGQKVFDGPTFNAVEVYKKIRTESLVEKSEVSSRLLSGKASSLNGKSGLSEEIILRNFEFVEQVNKKTFLLKFEIFSNKDLESIAINFGISSSNGITVCSMDGVKSGYLMSFLKSNKKTNCVLQFDNNLLPGKYYMSTQVNQLISDVTKPLALYQNFISFDIPGTDEMGGFANLNMKFERFES